MLPARGERDRTQLAGLTPVTSPATAISLLLSGASLGYDSREVPPCFLSA